MKGYLQRLFDSAAAAAHGPGLQPTQRSQSPLVALDQRLASAEFTSNFELGAIAEPAAMDGLGAQAPLDVPPQELAPRSAPPPLPTPLARNSHVDQPAAVVRHPGEEPRREAPAQPKVSPDPPPIEPTLEGPPEARREAPRAAPKEPRATRTEGNAVAAFNREPRQSEASVPEQAFFQPSPTPARREVEEPAPPPRREPRLDVTRSAAPPAPTSAHPSSNPEVAPTIEQSAKIPPRPLRPAPLEILEPLPPPRPASIDWEEIAPRIEALVRDAAARPSKATTQPQAEATGAAQTRSDEPPRPTTAEAASVIGPITRPARHVMLFGSRLR